MLKRRTRSPRPTFLIFQFPNSEIRIPNSEFQARMLSGPGLSLQCNFAIPSV
jgi:hypothetical protein